MSDYISKSKLLNKMAGCHYDTEHPLESYASLVNLINNARTDEVVFCRECRFFNGWHCEHDHWDVSQGCQLPEVYDSDFCSYGERREDEAD